MFEQTKTNKYTLELHNDIKILVPKYATLYKAIEKVAVTKLEDEATLLALAVKIDTLDQTFTNLKDICNRYFPPDTKKKQKKEV